VTMPVRDGSVRYITNSELQTFKTCKRKWWLAYWRRLTPLREDVTGVRSIGTRLHLALAARYTPDGTEADALVMLSDSYAADLVRLNDLGQYNEAEELMKDRDLAITMLEGYFDWTAEEGADVGIEVYATEDEISAELAGVTDASTGAPVSLLGRLDARFIREIDGARMFLDHKTVGSFSQATATLHMDEQMLMYHLLEILDGMRDGTPFEEVPRCDGGVYNMLRRVKRSSRSKPPYYGREEIRHNVHELRSFYFRTMRTIADIMQLSTMLARTPLEEQHTLAYPRPSRDCVWSCDYYMACPLFDDGSHVEGLLNTAFVNYDPLARYADNTSDLNEGETV